MSERDSKEIPCQRAMVKDVFCYGFRRGRQALFYGFRRWLFYGFRRGRERFFYGFRRWFFYGFRLLQDRGCVSDGNRKKRKRTFP